MEITSSEEGLFLIWTVSGKNGDVLEEKSAARALRASVPSRKIYQTSPLNSGSTFDLGTLTNLDNLTSLQSSVVQVRREELSGTPQLKDVDPTVDYSDGTTTGAPAFTIDPVSYGGETCNSGTTYCANQSFDAVNIYYHCNSYRALFNGYLAQLGTSADVGAVLNDPL